MLEKAEEGAGGGGGEEEYDDAFICICSLIMLLTVTMPKLTWPTQQAQGFWTLYKPL